MNVAVRSGELQGKVAIVTGGSGGIGHGIVLALAKRGARVVVNYLQHDKAANDTVEAALACGAERAMAVQADVSQEPQVIRLIERTSDEIGSPSIVVSNAGIITRFPFLEMGKAEFDKVIDTNLGGCFLVGREAARAMVKTNRGGRIINISSTSDRFAALVYAHYCASKAGITMITKVMALALAPYGITVNSVAPGLFITNINRESLKDPDVLASRLSRIPLSRVGTPEDVGEMVAFLASDRASYITGASFGVDGGFGIS